YISSHTLEGSSGSYGYPLFREVASKLSHIFQYAMNAVIAPDATAALMEFISEGIAVLESDLLMISANGIENAEETVAFKQKYAFAFEPAPTTPQPVQEYVAPINLHTSPELPLASEHAPVAQALAPESNLPETTSAAPSVTPSEIPDLEPDGDIPPEILEFFVPETEEHLQMVQDCLLGIETSSDPETVHRLFRSMHTIKGSAAQVGLQRISHVAHSAEDLIGRVRDGEIKPTQQVIDLCLETVDVIKKFIYRQWSDEATLQTSVKSLLGRMKEIAAAGEVTSADLSEAGLDSEVSADRVTTSVSIVSESAVRPRTPESAKAQRAGSEPQPA